MYMPVSDGVGPTVSCQQCQRTVSIPRSCASVSATTHCAGLLTDQRCLSDDDDDDDDDIRCWTGLTWLLSVDKSCSMNLYRNMHSWRPAVAVLV